MNFFPARRDGSDGTDEDELRHEPSRAICEFLANKKHLRADGVLSGWYAVCKLKREFKSEVQSILLGHN